MYGGYANTFSGNITPPQVALSEELKTRLNLSGFTSVDKIFFGCTGSDANDTMLKIANYYHSIIGLPDKTKVIVRKGAYHGTSSYTSALTGIPIYKKKKI